MLRGLMMGLALTLGLISGAWAQATDIEDVISDQIEAFQADDFEEAFTYASPNIRMLFRTPQNFGRMVTQGYPMVWRPAEVTFLELEELGSGYSQKVQVVDAEGRVHILDYRMLQTTDGWKINGVQLLESAGVSA